MRSTVYWDNWRESEYQRSGKKGVDFHGGRRCPRFDPEEANRGKNHLIKGDVKVDPKRRGKI